MEWLEGRVARVLYTSEATGYAVLKLETPQGVQVPCVGTLAALTDDLDEGDFLTLEGEWATHPTHGRQFKVSSLLSGSPRSLAGIRMYLGGGQIEGVGPRVADKIVEHFRERTPTIIAEEPERLTEVEGIGSKRAAAISKAWQEDEAGRALSMTLRGLGLTPRLIQRIRARYGDSTLQVVTRTPYRLAEEVGGIGFRTADGLARAQGIPVDDPERARAAVVYLLDQETSNGHCFLTRAVLRQRCRSLDVPEHRVDDAIGAAEALARVVVEEGEEPALDEVWGAGLAIAEQNVANELRARSSEPLPVVEGEVLNAMEHVGVQLDPGQQRAVDNALRHGVSIITGGPGTGKTTLVKVLLRAARERGEEWLLASPTGRAARRLADATGREAKTLHRLLEYRPDEGGFQRCRTNPLEGDGLVVDEASMVDIELMSALVDALPENHFRLVLVGDANQLPSVGPGQLLRDLIDSGAVSTAVLTTIHRQGRDSGIVHAASVVQQGDLPASGEVAGHDDYFHLDRGDAGAARDTVLKVIERLESKGFEARRDVQVLAPTRRGNLGTYELNRMLQARLNPMGQEVKRGDRAFRVGDRVICTKNRYDVEVFNGDVGEVTALAKTGLHIDFEGREVQWEWEELSTLDLAYCITVHKSQGSEYPAVVLALHRSHGVMLRRNLFYTGITRARRFCCVVGDRRSGFRAARTVGGDDRNTRLARRLREQA